MKTLVTGSDGFIGKNISADEQIGRNVDFMDFESVYNAISSLSGIDRIIHCAGKHGSSIEMTKDHASYIRTNFLCDDNLLKDLFGNNNNQAVCLLCENPKNELMRLFIDFEFVSNFDIRISDFCEKNDHR